MTDTPEERPEPRPVTLPSEGVPDVVRTPEALADTARRLRSAGGPVAIDTERAHGFRYWPKAYLIQLRREGGGTHLVDPVAFEGDAERADFSALADDLADTEWVLHAATQDLPCLAEVRLLPARLFDTELAGRLLGLPRVSLSALVERALGLALAKEHSAADWSRRPLPEPWLAYAALDVELLIELRDWAAAELTATGKDEWAAEEFAHLVAHAGDLPTPRAEPWRRVSGLHAVRTPRGLAAVRALWLARDEVARRLDRAPGRVLGDRAIAEAGVAVDAAHTTALGRDALRRIPGFAWRTAARYESTWVEALASASTLRPDEWPRLRATGEGIPHPKGWGRQYPEAAARWERVRPAVNALAAELTLPPENLLAPDALRRLAWEPPSDLAPDTVDAVLSEAGVRAWQRRLVVPVVTPLLAAD